MIANYLWKHTNPAIITGSTDLSAEGGIVTPILLQSWVANSLLIHFRRWLAVVSPPVRIGPQAQTSEQVTVSSLD